MNIRTLYINDLVNEYLDDPNCRPSDWIACEDVTEEERKEFFKGVKEERLARRRANFVAPDDTPSLDAPWYSYK